jgi:hypothetical protein
MLPATRLALLLAALVPIAGGGGIDTLLTSSGLRLAIVASKGRGVAGLPRPNPNPNTLHPEP